MTPVEPLPGEASRFSSRGRGPRGQGLREVRQPAGTVGTAQLEGGSLPEELVGGTRARAHPGDDGAVRKRDDGIVIIDPVKAKGQKQIVEACPYGAVSWNEAAQLPQAWTFDAHLLDQGWDKVRAQQACPTDVFRTLKVDDAEMQRISAAENLSVDRPELGTRPRVHYKNLHRMTHCFVGGTVVRSVNGVEECAAGAEVVLRQQGREIARTTTDTFGEFKIDRLPQHSGRYDIEVTGAGRASAEVTVGSESPYVGVLTLA